MILRHRFSAAPRNQPRQRPLLLIGLDWLRHKDPPISLASASIAAAVAERTHVECLSLNINSDDDLHAQVRAALAAMPDRPLVGLGAYIWAEEQLGDLLTTIKAERPDAAVVLGGPQVSYAPAGKFLSQAYPLVVGFIRGDGEGPMRALASGENLRPDGFHAAGEFDTGVLASPPCTPLPSPFLNGWVAPQRFLRWETARGCAFKCSFCQHKASDGRRQQLEAARVLAECDWLCAQSHDGPLRDLAVVDPTFNQGATHLSVLARLAEGQLRGKLSLQCRLEMLTPEFVNAVNELRGTAHVVLEFGLQTIHRGEQRLIERPNNARRIAYWLERLNSEGVPYELSFMYGLPAQTLRSFHETAEWAVRNVDAHATDAARVVFFPLMLLRGTRLHERAGELGLVASDRLGVDIHQRVGSGIPHVVASPSFTVEEWLQMHAVAEDINATYSGRTSSEPPPLALAS